jgi:TatD DNase family protein
MAWLGSDKCFGADGFLVNFAIMGNRRLIDTHCHLYLPEFSSDTDLVMERAQSVGVDGFFLPAIDSETTQELIDLEEKYTSCHAMMGLHPCSVKVNYRDELRAVEDWLARRKFAAVGEIGLDYYWDRSFMVEQKEAFRLQIEWSVKYGLPISIHSREAMADTIDIINEYAKKGARGIFHCFGGSYENAAEIIGAGFYLGIGGVLTYKKSGLAEVIERIGLEWLVLETDAPFLAPVPFRGKRNESSYLEYIAGRMAEIKGCSVEEVAAITTANAEKIFGAIVLKQ